MNEDLIEKLEKIAKKEANYDDKSFNAFEYSGGNYDDAYSLGCDDGEIGLAREILQMIKKQTEHKQP